MSEIILCPEREKIPSQAGSYAVLFSLTEEKVLQIGKRGKEFFLPGWYIYFGNAFGTGGLYSRISHHLRISERPHWHVDWFRLAARPEVVFFTMGKNTLECTWREVVETRLHGITIIRGFGASDCRNGCKSHLLFFKDRPAAQEIAEFLLLSLHQDENIYLLDLLIPAG